MQLILSFNDIDKAKKYMAPNVFDYIDTRQTESYEGFEKYNLISFDYYNVREEKNNASKLLIYHDRENLIIFCEEAPENVKEIFIDVHEKYSDNNAEFLYRFFSKMIHDDMEHLDKLELEISAAEDRILKDTSEPMYKEVSACRSELLRLKKYYEQLNNIFDELSDNDNGLLDDKNSRRIGVLGNRVTRYLNEVQNLREEVTQLREAYQSQLSIQQNDLMRMFTIVTAIFLPLTLIVGWYGMNFTNMPELTWKYGYMTVIAVSITLVCALIWYFKHKKWM